MKREQDYDAIVIGGGPGGSTAAGVLAAKGRRVLLLEKDKFPRYHVGESLMPYCYFSLERIGVIERMKASHYPKKYSVQFVSTNGHVSQPFYFFQHLEHEASTTWQVLRGEFDQMLLDNARAKGAVVLEETAAKDAIRRDGAKIAIWTYYEGALRDPGLDAGATTVAYLPEKGWFWYIPLPEDLVSVGVVAEKDYLYRDIRDLAGIFQREVRNNVWVEQHLAAGRQTGQYWVTGEYSYRSRYCAADGLILVGDAFAFLDPVFSSGVFLALRSGELAGEAVDAALSAGDVSASRFEQYGQKICQGVEAMRKLVYAFYDHEFNFREFVMRFPDLRGDLTDCLIGNLFRDFESLNSGLAEFATLPEELTHGRPLIEDREVASRD